MSGMNSSNQKFSAAGLMHLGVVYVVWSSTYMAMRVAVRPESGFPPFMMCASRMAAAALLLLGVAWLKRDRMAPARAELATLLVTGLLLWVGGNGLVVWAEQTANSGFAALVVSAAPIWVTLIELALFRKRPGARLLGSLALGFAGLGVLLAPSLHRGGLGDLASGIALVFGAASWAMGSIYQNRHPVRLSSTTTAAYQHLIACGGFLLAARLHGEPALPTPTPHAWMAWGYLVIFGALAFTSFVSALRLLPINITMTYAYVNPVLALLLGWWLLGEPVTRWTACGAVMVIISVVGIFRERFAPAPQSAPGGE